MMSLRCHSDRAAMPDAPKRRVLQILETYLPLIGGAEFHLHYLTLNLMAQGFEVEIVTGLGDSAVEHTDICPVHRLPHAVGRRAAPYVLVWLLRFLRMFFRFDIVHVHHSSFLAFIAVIVGRLTGKPVVVTLHGLGALDSSVGFCPIRRLYRWVSLKGASKIIATSDEMATVARRFVPEERIVIITNGVSTERFSPIKERSFGGAAETLRLATLRRMNPKNGVHFVIDALGLATRLGRDRLNFTLRMAGDGPLRPHIETLVTEYGLAERVRFEGFLSHRQVIPLLDECDVALFMSTAESTSLAALECMAMGCIVVCSNAGAFPLFVQNGETGFIIKLFPEGQSDYGAPMHLESWQNQLIAATLLAIQAMPAAELKRISKQARTYVRTHFEWSVITAQTVTKVYDTLPSCKS
ncbi:MAG: glycosyltransferase family 4 protein [Rhodospirillaceae bacterium]